MRRLPNVYPADTATWPNSEGTFDVGAADTGAKILMRNLTPLNLRLDFYNGSTDVLSAWEHNVWPLDGDSPTIGWAIDPDSPSVIAPPSNVVYLTLFNSTEKVPGTYPVFSVLQTSSGSTTGTGGTGTTNQLINTGNPAGQNVVTVNSTAAAGSTVTLSTDGLFQLLVTITGALVNAIKTNETDPILQLGALTHLVEVLGNLQVDGNLNGAFTMSTLASHAVLQAVPTSGLYLKDSGANNRIACDVDHTYVEAGTGNVLLQSPAGTTQLTAASTGVTVKGSFTSDNGAVLTDGVGNTTVNTLKLSGNKLLYSGGGNGLIDATSGVDMYFNPPSSTGKVRLASTATFNFVSGRVARFDKVNFTAAAGTYPTTKTYTHGLGYTPDFIWIMPGQDVASFGSCTIGVWNWNGTTFDVTLGAQINFQAFFIKLDP